MRVVRENISSYWDMILSDIAHKSRRGHSSPRLKLLITWRQKLPLLAWILFSLLSSVIAFTFSGPSSPNFIVIKFRLTKICDSSCKFSCLYPACGARAVHCPADYLYRRQRINLAEKESVIGKLRGCDVFPSNQTHVYNMCMCLLSLSVCGCTSTLSVLSLTCLHTSAIS